MTPALQKIENEALLLPPEDREQLIQKLQQSLDSSGGNNNINQAWIQEAEKRYNDYKNGISKGIPGDTIFSEIRRELGWQS